ncbi:MAG: glycosyl hydrolase family 79 C-terminal domain-containing protein [Solirubrobacteraceae bacterium]
MSVSVDPAAVIGPVVPGDFLGLSFEAADLHSIATYANSGDLVNLLRSLGPGILRFGGISADRNTAWLQEGLAPAWAQATIVPADLAALAGLARETGWRVLLTVNLDHYDPAAAAQEAQVAQALLGPGLAGIAIGNEPDRYVADGFRTAGWSLAAYLAEAEAYRAAIAAAAPGVQIVGPDASSPQLVLPWLTTVATSERPALLTDHYYPLTKCGKYRTRLSDLLSPVTRAHETAMLAQLAAIARVSALPLRLDETNNVSCHGQPGVSNVFASALWAVDYLARAMASGLSGINFHDLIDEPRSYSPLAAGGTQELASGALYANPEWYALLLARHLLGDEPVRARVTGNRVLTAGAFLSPSGSLHIVLVNFASPGAQLLVRLRPPRSFAAGPILRLTAPGLEATTGVTLGARSVSGAGTWSHITPLPSVSGRPGSLELGMPASSAALVTLYPSG